MKKDRSMRDSRSMKKNQSMKRNRSMKKDRIMRRALRTYNAYNPKYFPLCLLQTVFRNASFYFNLWVSAEIVTALYEGRERRELYLLVTAALLGVFAVRAVAAWLDRAVGTALEVLENNEAAAFNCKTLSLDYDKIEAPEIRQLRRKIDENSWINNYGVGSMRDSVLKLMYDLVNLAFSAVLFAEMIVRMTAVPFQGPGLILILALCGSEALHVFFQSREAEKIAGEWDTIGSLMLQENRISQGYQLDGMDSRIYCQQGFLDGYYKKMIEDHRKAFSKVHKKRFVLDIPPMSLGQMTETASYLIVSFYCLLGAFPIGSIIKYVGYLGRAMGCIGDILGTVKMCRSNERFLETYLAFFDVNNDMYQGSLAVEKRSDKKFDIEFRNVSFRYAGSNEYALRHIDLNLRVGERLAVVGMNGSGKTTFIKLLCRLYDPTEGEILMNDFNIRKYDYRQYLDIFSVVFQDYNLLAMPLGSNVACAAGWDGEKAERLLREVGFGDRYDEMPKGLDTPIYKDFDTDGVEVSGGEAQKIALARALYKDAPFIILDEPTAALDPIAEAEIYSKFDQIVGDKTAIYISHRLSSCRFCDKIAVFHEGRIVQTGTHEELLQDAQGKYYELWHTQAQYYT